MSSMDDRFQANGTKLCRLLIDKGTEAMRNVFNSICPPPTLTATLNINYNLLQRRRVINRSQKDTLFPPIPLAPSTSEDYDITLLFILLRNICGLHPPASTGGSWDKLPPPTDPSREANLARIKYYRNVIYGHITTTAVNDINFQFYWNDISTALIGLSVNVDEIEDLRKRPLEENVYFQQLVDWKENEEQMDVRWKENRDNHTKLQNGLCLLSLLLLALIALVLVLALIAFGMFSNSSKEANQHSFALDFSSHLNNSNSDFVGRKWFFQELEHAINNSREQPGVIILGDPGSGKSAIMSQLISSPSSSPFIHKNVIGYHVCKFDERRTRDGMRFVHTLVEQLSKNIPEYSSAIKELAIQKELKPILCTNDPIGCFHTTILDPIKKLQGQQNTNKYILIDALDECMKKGGKSSDIITILKNKMIDFPPWIKLIISSRNKTPFIAQLPTFEKLAINSTDQRNLEDIRSYIAEHFTLGNNRFKTEAEKKYVEGLIKQLSKINEGNFLYFKTLLRYLNKNNVSNPGRDFFPPTLDHLYGFIFRDRFGKEDFESFAPLFEVLLASKSPPNMTKLEAILKIREDTYNARRVVKQVSEYLIIGSDETVRFYHQSFANWLMNQTDNIDGLFIKKSKGHQYIMDYLFDYFHKSGTLEELKELSKYVLFGEMEEKQVSKLEALNVSEIRDPSDGECILHKLARERESTPIIKIFLKKFDSIDIFSKYDNSTPLCHAASMGNHDNLKLFIDSGADVNNVFNSHHKTILTIARKGYTKIAKLLIRNGVDFDKGNQYKRKPLREAALYGHFDFVKVLVNKGVKPDVGVLYYAAQINHSDIVRFLLDSGIRDECVACKPGDRYSCQTTYHLNHHSTNSCFCQTALYAAVFWGHLNIVKLLLFYGNASLECKDHLGQTPLLYASKNNKTEMATLLLKKGANIEAKCETLINIYESDLKFYTKNCTKIVCSCGTRSIHLFAKQRSWEMVKELVSRWTANPFSENCQGLTLVSFAIMQDRVDIIRDFNATYVGGITNFIMNKTALRYTAVCGSLETLKWLTSIANSSFFQTVYEDGMTLLHLASNWSVYPVISPDDFSWKIQSCTENIYRDFSIPFLLQYVNEYKKCLITVRLLTKLHQNIDKTDKYGRTALHYAAARGFAGAVRHLVRQGSDWRIKDQTGYTPLELALKESPLHPKYFLPCRMTSDGVFQSCNSTMFDETVRYLIMIQKSSIKKCNKDTKRLLRTLVKKNMPLSLYDLFKIGVDVNCGVALKMQLINMYIVTTNDEISEVFKIFEVNVNVKCDVPFTRSELHLMAYLTRPNNIGNFFKPSVNNRSFPFQRLVNNHPKGFRVLDECYDEEGYLAIHRAVQGGNVDAVSWFISLGVDIFKKTRSGWNALDISTYNLALGGILEHKYNTPNVLTRTYEKLLEQFLKTIKYKNSTSFPWCKPEFTELSPLHIAASQGMELLEYVHKNTQRLPISCTNYKHGIEPRYIAYLYESTEVINDIFPTLYPPYEGRYPEREAEYHLIYNYIFQTPEVDLSFELDFEGLFKCPGMNDFLPELKDIEEQIEQCNNHCWKNTSQVIRNFLSAFPYIVIQNASFDPFAAKGFIHTVQRMLELRYHTMKMFYKIPSRFWRKVSEAYSCSYRCRCVEIMRLLYKQFTSQPRRVRVNIIFSKFMTNRMGWKDTRIYGSDAQYQRWPFRFLLKKALKQDKDYEYLKVFGEITALLLY